MLNSLLHRSYPKQFISSHRITAAISNHRWFTKKLGKEEERASEEVTVATSTTTTTDAGQDQRERDRLIRDSLPVTFADISRAHVAIRDGIVRTKCEKSVFLSEIIGANIYLKPEFRQFTGSFKERGARNAILKLKHRNMEAAKRGVIAASAGNHALALAYHGRELGIPVTVVMPTVAPLAKVDKCRKFGARIIIEGMHIGESKTYAETLVHSEGLTYINGYDDPPIIAGAGTIGIELIDDVPNVDVVVVPVGGAGLIAGISCSVKTLKPEVTVSS
jgi:threonine dehydratase